MASLLLRTLGAVSPAAAARLGMQLFRLTGPRRPPRFTPAPGAVERFRVGRHRVASYIWHGGGPTVVLVHGWNGTAGDLSAFIGPLRDTGRRVVAIDLPAHGRSPGRRSDLTEAVQVVEAVLRREPSIEAVIAHSFGVPATVLAAARGAPLPRTVLISGPIAVEPYLERFGQVLGLSPSIREALRRRLRTLLERAGLLPVELNAVAPRLGTPALIVHDRSDREVPFLSAQLLHRAWPGSELLATEGLGHRRLLAAPAVVERAVRFAVGWERAEVETPRPPLARELRVVAG
ncbi:MAG TPA: alpha/beta hydrolase [Myxococcaceae bacterium]|nr:alpha/beta hydrolase [Myxococcaceae bacterium]